MSQPQAPFALRIAVVTISDKGSRGERQDTAGPAIRETLEQAGLAVEVAEYRIVPDEADLIRAILVELTNLAAVDVVLTTGGTGLAPRDVTPQATLAVVEYEAPGFGEAMRAASLRATPMGILSRATAGVRNRKLIVNLPGSPKAVRENLAAIASVLPHAVETLRGTMGDHA